MNSIDQRGLSMNANRREPGMLDNNYTQYTQPPGQMITSYLKNDAGCVLRTDRQNGVGNAPYQNRK